MRRSQVLVVVLAVVAAFVAPLSASGAAGAPAGGWGRIMNLSTGSADAWGPELARTGSRTVAVWGTSGGGHSPLMITWQRADGSWSAPRAVPASGGAREARVALTRDGSVVMAWAAGRRVVTVRRPAGRAWTRPVTLHRTRNGVLGTFPANLQLAVNDHGHAVVAWGTMDDDMDAVHARSRVQVVGWALEPRQNVLHPPAARRTAPGGSGGPVGSSHGRLE